MDIIIQKIFNTDFLFRWQTLIGSALGPFLAIFLSYIIYLIKGKLQKMKERREAIRRAEISFSITLNQIYTTIGHLNSFVFRAKKITEEIKTISDPAHYYLIETNFPPVINIYFDEELLKMKFKSYYMHNKILIIDTGIRWTNSTIQAIKFDYEKLLKRNELMADKDKPANQRESYIKNLEGYIEMIETFLNSLKNQNIKSIVQAKVYNLKLMKKYYSTLWNYEGATLKYFKNKKEKEKYNRDISAVDRIDKLFKKEVNELLDKTNKRAADFGI